jgi:hypothetical protein
MGIVCQAIYFKAQNLKIELLRMSLNELTNKNKNGGRNFLPPFLFLYQLHKLHYSTTHLINVQLAIYNETLAAYFAINQHFSDINTFAQIA